MSDWYILGPDHEVLPATIYEWSRWNERGFDQKRVARTQVGDADVSTVFLGLDHGWGDHDRPIVFETLVFGGPLADEGERYATWDEAVAGHERIVERCRMAAHAAFQDVP